MRRMIAAATSALLGLVGLDTHAGLPTPDAPAPAVAGIPTPCVSLHPFPEDASMSEIREQMEAHFGFRLEGSQWTQEHLAAIRIIWQTLDAVACTPYLDDLQAKQPGTVRLNATSIRGYAWGDWSLTKTGAVSLDLAKFQTAIDASDEGRIVRLVIHELAHVYNSDRFAAPSYWADFQELYEQEGRFSEYAGSSVTETWADVVGYYVGRCAIENPYDTGEFEAYYAFAKDQVFGGKEFGPAPGSPVECEVTAQGRIVEPQAAAQFSGGVAAWVKDLTAA